MTETERDVRKPHSHSYSISGYPMVIDQLSQAELMDIRAGTFVNDNSETDKRRKLGLEMLAYIEEKGDRTLEEIPSVIALVKNSEGDLVFVREELNPLRARRFGRETRSYE